MVGARRGVEAWSQVVHQLTKLQTSEQNGGCAGEMTMPALAGERRSERAKCGVAAAPCSEVVVTFLRSARGFIGRRKNTAEHSQPVLCLGQRGGGP